MNSNTHDRAQNLVTIPHPDAFNFTQLLSFHEFLWVPMVYNFVTVHWYEGQLQALDPLHHKRLLHNLEHPAQSD